MDYPLFLDVVPNNFHFLHPFFNVSLLNNYIPHLLLLFLEENKTSKKRNGTNIQDDVIVNFEKVTKAIHAKLIKLCGWPEYIKLYS